MDSGLFLTTITPAIAGSDTGSLPPSGFAAQNAATTGNWLDGGDAAGLRVIGTDNFIIGGWIKWNDNVDSVPLTKGDTNASTAAYGFYITGISGVITFGTNDGTNTPTIDSAVGIVSGTKSFFLAWADQTSINIQIDNGTVTSNSTVRINLSDVGGNFILLSNDDGAGGLGFKGILDEVFFCKNPSDMTTAISTIQSNIYNSGNGIRYKDVSPTDKTTIGLVSWWTLDDATAANRLDSNSTNDLTKHGTVTQVAPLVS